MLESIAERFREKKPRANVPVIDLDAICETEQYVQLHGKTHVIKPVLLEEFYALANAWAGIQMLTKEEKVTHKQMVDAYYSVIMPICPSITVEDLQKCTAAQLSALLQLVIDHQNGRQIDEKKKTALPTPKIFPK